MIELKRNVVIFTILAVVAVYFLYEDLRKLFTPTIQASEKVDLVSDELTEGYIGRKLLALASNVNEDSLKPKPELYAFLKEKHRNDEKIKGISKNFVYNKLSRNRMKKLIRRKRNTRRNDFGWKLSLNVTSNKNLPNEVSNLGSEDDLSSKSENGKLLNMAIQMEGASHDNSYKELHKTWDSIGLFLRSLYGKNASFKGNDRNITADVSTESNHIESPDSPTEKPERERKPKFLFGLLNFGSSENPPLESKGTTLENRDSSESVTSQKTNVVPMEGPTTTKAPLSRNDTEEPLEAYGLVELVSEETTIVPIGDTFVNFESTSSEFNTQFVEKLEKTSSNPTEIKTLKPEPSYTSEQLKEFCISLLSRIHDAPKSIDRFSEEDGSGELDKMAVGDQETMTGFQPLVTDVPKEVTTKSTNQRFGVWSSIWNRIAGRRLVQQPIDVGLRSSITPKYEITLEETKDGTDEALISNVESSNVLGISDSTESDDSFSDENGSALTVPDCESFFRQIQNDAVFAKPNLLDIINNPILLSLQPSQFNFTEMPDDKQMRSMRADSTDPESNVLFTEEMNVLYTPSVDSKPKEISDGFAFNELPSEPSDKNSFENTSSYQDPLSTSNSFDIQGNFQNGAYDKSEIDNSITVNGKDLRKSATEDEEKFLSEEFTTERVQIQSFTGLFDEGLFVQSDVRAKTEMSSSEVSTQFDERIFGLLNFGGSGDDETRIFPALLNIFGSGDGRELSETPTDPEFNTKLSECLDCFENKSNFLAIDDYDDCGSDINDTHMLTGEKLPTTINPLTNKIVSEASVHDDAIYLNNKDSFSEEKFAESQNAVLGSTNIPATELLSEDQTSFQNFLDERRGDDEKRIFPALLNIFGSGDGREFSETPSDPEPNTKLSECLDCFENKNSFLAVDDYGSDINDTDKLTSGKSPTTINPLTNKIVSEASVHDAIYLNNKDSFSKSNEDVLESSTRQSPKSIISSSASETINNENYDNSANISYEVTSYENYDNSANISYEATNYENYDNSENTGYGMKNYEYHYPENNGYIITTPLPLQHTHVEGECDESHFDIKTEAFSTSPTESATVSQDFRFIDTLFLTGSGAGGLFGNDDGEINLVQEQDTTSFSFQDPSASPRQVRRGGRMDDSFFPSWPEENREHDSGKQFDFTKSQETFDNSNLNSQDASLDHKAFQKPEDKGFSTDSISQLIVTESIQTVEDEFNKAKISKDTAWTFQGVSNEAVTTISNQTSSFVIPKKAKELPPRYCNHAGECNIALNEGCITKKGRGVCDCRRSFVRHPDTDICEAPFMMRTSLKLPDEVFHEDLRDKHTELYKNKTRDAIDTMWLVVYQDSTLLNNVANIDVAGFEEGSLVVHWKIILAVKNVNIMKIVQEVDEKLEENFKLQTVLESAPLNVRNAKMLSFSDVNPCEQKELNYCSSDAVCIRDEYQGFRCHCKDGYLDNSKNPMYPGEICIAACPQNYCGENGYCEARLNGEIQCLCNGWNFGEKCNVSGILVISCFAGANFVLIVLVLAAVFFCKRRRQCRTRFYENNQIVFEPNREAGPFGRVSPRLAASIALDDLGPTKASKYMAISTPLYMKPDIQITSPSIMGSSLSYDYDSTFDRTPSAEVNVDPPKYDAVPEVPKYNSVPEV